MRWYHGLWIAILVSIATVAAYFLGGRKSTLKKTIALERKVIEGKAQAKRHLAEDGADIARRRIEREHILAIDKLDKEDRDEAIRLRTDPAALIEHILRASS